MGIIPPHGDVGAIVPLLSFIEQNWRYEELCNIGFPNANSGAYGALPSVLGRVNSFLCPSDVVGDNGRDMQAYISGNECQPKHAYVLTPLGLTAAEAIAQYGSKKLTYSSYVFSLGDFARASARNYKLEAPTLTESATGYCDQRNPYITSATNSPAYSTALQEAKTFESITDGLSNTIFMSERGILAPNVKGTIRGSIKTNIGTLTSHILSMTPQMCLNTLGTAGSYAVADTDCFNRYYQPSGVDDTSDPDQYHANFLFLSSLSASRFSTILPPNSPSCLNGRVHQGGGILSANSYHRGGVNGLIGDGAVRFISDNINYISTGTDMATIRAGNPAEVTGVSPFGIWGALGSINGGDIAEMP
jgi:hypothetical protein